jgi:PAS domain S-box
LYLGLTRRREIDPDYPLDLPRTYIYDKNLRYLYVSIAGARLAGVLPADFIGKHWRELRLPTAMEEIETEIQAVFAAGRPRIAEAFYPTLAGLNYVQFRLTPLISRERHVEAVMATVKTITAEKLMELEFNHQAGAFAQAVFNDQHAIAFNPLHTVAVFANCRDALLLTTPEGRILDANPAACSLFGMSLDELRCAGRDTLVDSADQNLAAALAVRKEKGAVNATLTLIRKDGTKFLGEVTTKIFTTKSGDQYTSMVIRDISGRCC